MAQNAGKVIPRDELYQQLHGVRYDGMDRSIDLRVSRLRRQRVCGHVRNHAALLFLADPGALFATSFGVGRGAGPAAEEVERLFRDATLVDAFCARLPKILDVVPSLKTEILAAGDDRIWQGTRCARPHAPTRRECAFACP